MERISLDAAEELAERCLDACNQLMEFDKPEALEALFTSDVEIDVVETSSYVLNGVGELADRLRASAYHGGLILHDAHEEGNDVVAGVAWADDPTIRIAEVRMFRRGEQICRMEWME